MSKQQNYKERIGGRYTPLLISTLDAPAWMEMSHGAKWLYVALKRRKPNGRNRAFVSYRNAQRELKASPKKIREWFAELEHYGFIQLAVRGSLGVDGKGKAPHWTLTECGQTSKTSAEGLFEPPTNEFLKWDGILFDPTPFRESVKWDENKLKKQNPASHVGSTPVSHVGSTQTPKCFPRGAHRAEQKCFPRGAHN